MKVLEDKLRFIGINCEVKEDTEKELVLKILGTTRER